MSAPFGLIDFLSPPAFIIVAVLAVLLYGERLPEVAKKFGKNFVDFKKSIQGIREEFEAAVNNVSTSVTSAVSSIEESVDREEATAPKFEPPPAAAPEGLHEEPTAPRFQPPPLPSAGESSVDQSPRA
jgi:sec-independent protein translocase protein TatA